MKMFKYFSSGMKLTGNIIDDFVTVVRPYTDDDENVWFVLEEDKIADAWCDCNCPKEWRIGFEQGLGWVHIETFRSSDFRKWFNMILLHGIDSCGKEVGDWKEMIVGRWMRTVVYPCKSISVHLHIAPKIDQQTN